MQHQETVFESLVWLNLGLNLNLGPMANTLPMARSILCAQSLGNFFHYTFILRLICVIVSKYTFLCTVIYHKLWSSNKTNLQIVILLHIDPWLNRMFHMSKESDCRTPTVIRKAVMRRCKQPEMCGRYEMIYIQVPIGLTFSVSLGARWVSHGGRLPDTTKKGCDIKRQSSVSIISLQSLSEAKTGSERLANEEKTYCPESECGTEWLRRKGHYSSSRTSLFVIVSLSLSLSLCLSHTHTQETN